jgi:hypothetical protein
MTHVILSCLYLNASRAGQIGILVMQYLGVDSIESIKLTSFNYSIVPATSADAGEVRKATMSTTKQDHNGTERHHGFS